MAWNNRKKFDQRKARRQKLAQQEAKDARRAAYRSAQCAKQVGEMGEWCLVPSHCHAGPYFMDVWSCRIFGFDVMMTLTTRRPDPKVSFRRLRMKGLPYTGLDRYPSIDVARMFVPYDLSQRLLEMEYAKPVLEDHREVASHAIHCRRTYRPLEADPFHPPASP